MSYLPTTKSYLSTFFKKVFEPSVLGRSQIIYCLPKAGTNSLCKYCIKYGDKIDTYMYESISRHDYYFCEIAEDILTDFYNPLIDKLIDLNYITKSVNKGDKLVFIINNSQNLTKNVQQLENLRKIYALNTASVKFILLNSADPDLYSMDTILTSFGIENDCYVELRNDEDIKVLIEKEEIWHNYSVANSVKDAITKLSGGYSALARTLIAISESSSDMDINTLVSSVGVIRWFDLIWNSLSILSQHKLLELIVLDQPVNIIYLNKTGVANSKQIFTPLFEMYLKEKVQAAVLDLKDGKLSKLGIMIEQTLSPQEKLLLDYLITKEGELVSRNDIAKVLWGSKYIEKYSDWAIDKIISQLRIKLFDNDSKNIETKKGEGIIFRLG